MKAVRSHDCRIDRVRECEFYQSRYRQRAFYLQGFLEARRSRKRNPDCMEGLKPSAKLALFFCKNACSLEDGHDEHYYYDKGLEPPKRIQP